MTTTYIPKFKLIFWCSFPEYNLASMHAGAQAYNDRIKQQFGQSDTSDAGPPPIVASLRRVLPESTFLGAQASSNMENKPAQ